MGKAAETRFWRVLTIMSSGGRQSTSAALVAAGGWTRAAAVAELQLLSPERRLDRLLEQDERPAR